MTCLKTLFIGLALIQAPVLTAAREERAHLAWGLSDRQGKRNSMEDAYVVQQLELLPDGPPALYFGLFDGHGGSRASKCAAQHAPKDFFDEYKRFMVIHDNHEQVIKEALTNSYSILDNRIKVLCDDGTTAVTAVLVGEELYIAWVGDSRVLVLDAEGNIKASTVDHKPNSPGELKRIGDWGRITQQCFLLNDKGQFQQVFHSYGTPIPLVPNQHVHSEGPWRLGPLAVSRSLGDKMVRKHEPLVSAEPEIITVSVAPGDRVVLACDGVWDVLDNAEVAAFVTKKMTLDDTILRKEYPVGESFFREAMEEVGSDGKLALVARALRDKAYNEGSTDNISVMVFEIPLMREARCEKQSFFTPISAWVNRMRALLKRVTSLLY